MLIYHMCFIYLNMWTHFIFVVIYLLKMYSVHSINRFFVKLITVVKNPDEYITMFFICLWDSFVFWRFRIISAYDDKCFCVIYTFISQCLIVVRVANTWLWDLFFYNRRSQTMLLMCCHLVTRVSGADKRSHHDCRSYLCLQEKVWKTQST